MAASLTSTTETTNFARICRLVVEVIPDIFRALFIRQLPSGLPSVLSMDRSKIEKLLNNQQKRMLYPTGGVFQGSEKDIDLSLLYIILRNVGNIAPHQKGWGVPPDPSDWSLSANIDRLRQHRNKVAHANDASISVGDFQARFSDIRQCVVEIEKSHLKTRKFRQMVDSIRTVTMDPDVETKYITIVKNLEGKQI